MVGQVVNHKAWKRSSGDAQHPQVQVCIQAPLVFLASWNPGNLKLVRLIRGAERAPLVPQAGTDQRIANNIGLASSTSTKSTVIQNLLQAQAELRTLAKVQGGVLDGDRRAALDQGLGRGDELCSMALLHNGQNDNAIKSSTRPTRGGRFGTCSASRSNWKTSSCGSTTRWRSASASCAIGSTPMRDAPSRCSTRASASAT